MDVAVNSSTNRLYVANVGSDTVSVVNTTGDANTVIATVTVGDFPAGLAADQGASRVYVANRYGNTLSVIDTANDANTVVATVPAGNLPWGVAFNPSSNRIDLGTYTGNSIRVIEATAYQTVATLSVGNDPMYVAVNPSTGRVYAVNRADNTVSVLQEPSISAFVYDGDGNRVKKLEGGQSTVYPNRYYEKNVTTGVVTLSYWLGDRLLAVRKGSTLEYVHQDHLGGTVLSTNTSGATVSSIKYFPFGATRSSSGTLGTDRKYTGQRLDGAGLYFYNARYYDPGIGRFVSPDSIVPDPSNPQNFNRYSYVRNNPLKFTDPTGYKFEFTDPTFKEAYQAIVDDPNTPTWIRDMLLGLESSSQIITVAWNPFGAGQGSIGQGLTEWAIIWIDPDTQKYGIGTVASVFAHESYHVSEGNLGTTIEEEALAFSIQFTISVQFGLFSDPYRDNPFARAAYNVLVAKGSRSVDLQNGAVSFSDSYLDSVKNYLRGLGGKAGEVYRVAPPRQSDMNWRRIFEQLKIILS